MVKNSLKNTRLKKGYTQEDLARKVNCTLRTIQKIEENRGYNTSVEIAIKISKNLNKKVEELFEVY